jgi:hypothetical protein
MSPHDWRCLVLANELRDLAAAIGNTNGVVHVSSDQVSGNDNGTGGRTRVWRFRHVVHRYINPITRPVAKQLTHLRHPDPPRAQERTYIPNADQRLPAGQRHFFFLTYGSDVQLQTYYSTVPTTRSRPVAKDEPPLRRLISGHLIGLC